MEYYSDTCTVSVIEILRVHSNKKMNNMLEIIVGLSDRNPTWPLKQKK